MCCDLSGTKPLSSQPSDIQNARDKDGVSHVGVSLGDGVKITQKRTVLSTARVKIRGENGVTEANLLFDTGSDRTYISSS
jgi:hypothetical protein